MGEYRLTYGPVTLVVIDDVLSDILVKGDAVSVDGFDLSKDTEREAFLKKYAHKTDKNYTFVPEAGVLLGRFSLKDKSKRTVDVFAKDRADFYEAMLKVR